MFENRTPTVRDEALTRLLADLIGNVIQIFDRLLYFFAGFGADRALSLMTLETVIIETPAFFATSLILTTAILH